MHKNFKTILLGTYPNLNNTYATMYKAIFEHFVPQQDIYNFPILAIKRFWKKCLETYVFQWVIRTMVQSELMDRA